MTNPTQAAYYPPYRSARIEVSLVLDGDRLLVEGGGVRENCSLSECRINTPFTNLPMIIELPNEARLEIDNYKDILRYLIDTKHRKPVSIFELENNNTWLATSVASFIGVILLCVFVIIPTFSQTAAKMVPDDWANRIDTVVFLQLNKQFLGKSKLSSEKKKEIVDIFLLASKRPSELYFREGGILKANAFALANKKLVITDELVKILPNNEAILAILLHEEGHLLHRHVLKGIIQNSTLTALHLALLGDVAGVPDFVSSIGFTLSARSFQRDDEAEADQHAILQLIELGLSPHCLKQGFLALKKYYGHRSRKSSAAERLFATHPSLDQRIQRIERDYPDADPCDSEKDERVKSK